MGRAMHAALIARRSGERGSARGAIQPSTTVPQLYSAALCAQGGQRDETRGQGRCQQVLGMR
jgi:hypothetical protein